MITHRYNENIECLEISIDDLIKGIEYALINNHTCIRIMNLNQLYNDKFILDFKVFKKLPNLKSIIINDDFKISKVLNFDYLKDLNHLDYFQSQQPLSVDLSYISNVKNLYLKFTPKMMGFNTLVNVQDLLISSLKSEDCTFLSSMKLLKRLRLSGNFQSLNGVESLKNLKELSISQSPKIDSIEPLKELIQLEQLRIECCKSLTNFSVLSKLDSLKELFLSEIDSLQHINKLSQLVKLTFLNCVDGDLSMIKEMKTLQSLNFHPQKKHYSHTLAELKSELKIAK